MPVMTWTVRSREDLVRGRLWADQIIFHGFEPWTRPATLFPSRRDTVICGSGARWRETRAAAFSLAYRPFRTTTYPAGHATGRPRAGLPHERLGR